VLSLKSIQRHTVPSQQSHLVLANGFMFNLSLLPNNLLCCAHRQSFEIAGEVAGSSANDCRCYPFSLRISNRNLIPNALLTRQHRLSLLIAHDVPIFSIPIEFQFAPEPGGDAGEVTQIERAHVAGDVGDWFGALAKRMWLTPMCPAPISARRNLPSLALLSAKDCVELKK